jgi:hypothetical protein
MVWRSWAAGIDDPEFCNAKLRAPICFNPPAARFSRTIAGLDDAESIEPKQS